MAAQDIKNDLLHEFILFDVLNTDQQVATSNIIDTADFELGIALAIFATSMTTDTAGVANVAFVFNESDEVNTSATPILVNPNVISTDNIFGTNFGTNEDGVLQEENVTAAGDVLQTIGFIGNKRFIQFVGTLTAGVGIAGNSVLNAVVAQKAELLIINSQTSVVVTTA